MYIVKGILDRPRAQQFALATILHFKSNLKVVLQPVLEPYEMDDRIEE